jgi:hypothetical protein
MILQCAECKRYAISVISKRKYLIKLGVALSLLVLGCLIIYGMILENDLDIVIAFGLILGSVLIITCVPLSIFYAIKALKAKETVYTCGYCKCRLDDEQVIRIYDNETDILMSMVRKKKSAN